MENVQISKTANSHNDPSWVLRLGSFLKHRVHFLTALGRMMTLSRTCTARRNGSALLCAEDYPSPPTSISPVPPQVWHSPLPPHMEQEESSPNAARISSPAGFPLPWQPAQYPSPGESQLWQVWVVMPHLPQFDGDCDPGSRLCQIDAGGASVDYETPNDCVIVSRFG
jgi:hypothetical protein